MENKNGIVYVLLAIILLGVGALLVRQQLPSLNPGGATDSVAFTALATSSAQTVSNTSSVVMATDTAAQWRVIQNNSAQDIYLRFGSGAPALVGQGYVLHASSTLDLTLDRSNMYRGAITGITAGGSATALVNSR